MTKTGIKTIGEKGILFRSRIEARWAKMFTELGFDWDYEPFDLDGYIPDFIIRLPNEYSIEILVEVKSTTNFETLFQYKNKIEESGWKGHYLIVGSKIWNLDDLKKYEKSNIKEMLYLLSFFATERTVIGLLGISTYIKYDDYKNKNIINLLNGIEKLQDIKELYIIKDNKSNQLIKTFKSKNEISNYIYDKINSIKINDNVNIDYNISLINTKDIKWIYTLCLLGLEDIIDNIDKMNQYVKDKKHMIYFCFNKEEYNFKNKKYFWKSFINNDYEFLYYEKINKIWINIQNEYQYKNIK